MELENRQTVGGTSISRGKLCLHSRFLEAPGDSQRGVAKLANRASTFPHSNLLGKEALFYPLLRKMPNTVSDGPAGWSIPSLPSLLV